MVVRRKAPATPVKRTRPAAKAAAPVARRKPAPKVNPMAKWAESEAVTDYHKAYARFIVREIGYNPDESSPRVAFLRGVAIATLARTAFAQSEFLAEWRTKNGVAKKGPKPKAAVELDEDDEEYEDEEDTDAEDFEDEDADEADEDEDFDEDEDDEDEDFEEEDEEPAPVKRGPGRPRKVAVPAAEAPVKRGPGRPRKAVAAAPAKATKAAPAKRTRAAAPADEEFVF